MNNPWMKFLAAAVALALGVAAWFLVRPRPSVAHTSVIRPDNLVKAPAAPAVSVRSDLSVGTGESTRRPRMIGPTGAILTGGKPLEEVQIQYWAEFYEFDLTDEELRQAQAAYTDVLAARRRLEDSLAQVERKTASHFKIVIPAYPEAGRELRQQFEADLVSVLGVDRAGSFYPRAGRHWIAGTLGGA